MFCPVCGNDCLIEGERCDVGFGYHMGVKVEPDFCPMCFYVEPSSYYESDFTFEQFEKCWELQIEPVPPIPICSVGVVKEEYKSFFLDQEEAYGNCYHQCLKMVEQFPELKIVDGYYIDLIWGPRNHFWCVDGEIIVDPTKSQFPFSNGMYSPKSYISKEKLERFLNPKKGFDNLA